MPRAPSSKSNKTIASQRRHNPLPVQLKEDELVSRFGTVSTPGRRSKRVDNNDQDQNHQGDDDDQDVYAAPKGMVTGGKSGGPNKDKKFIDPKLSRNILRLAREQQDELEAEELELKQTQSTTKEDSNSHFQHRSGGIDFPDDDDDEEEEAEGGADDSEELDEEQQEQQEEQWDAYDAHLEIDPSDRALLEKFQAEHGTGDDNDDDDDENDQGMEGRRGNKTLADLIMEKIDAAEAAGQEIPNMDNDDERRMPPGINPKVIQVYTKVGELLSRYKSGPLPKALKIVPSLPAWETILYITDPASWTAHATLASVRIFASSMKSDQVEKFYNLVLLDKVRDEIQDEGKVSYQTYEAVKKAVYKPAAFFKGFLFPLCESGTLTLKEAAIVSSVLTKVSIPVLHSAAALLRLAEMEYSGPTSLFIRVLLDKKYALPYKVVDALVFHYIRFADPKDGVEVDKFTGQRRMPVLWHQSLLVFAQRYKQDLTPDQKGALLDLLRVQKHDGISPEVRRELVTAQTRGEMLEEPVDEDEDDMMSV